MLAIHLCALLTVALPLAGDSVRDLSVPRGYQRITYPADSFSGWIQRLPTKNNTSILTHRGERLPSRVYDRLAVLDRPLLFSDDLEQCADFAMRLWADYHQETDRLENLYLLAYGGEKQYFSTSDLSYTGFLRRAFAYSNSHSLKQGCVEPATEDANGPRPGDMIVQNDTGGIGHVSMIVDACQDAGGNRLFLIGFSFMPAQEFHVERATAFRMDGTPVGKEGWFSYEGYIRFLNAYYPFGTPVLRRFE